MDELYFRLYETEWERKNALQGDTGLPVGVLAFAGSGLVVLVKEYSAGGGFLDWMFWISLAGAVTAYGFALYFITRSVYGHVYRHLPFASELKRYHDGLINHHTALGRPLLAEMEFRRYLATLLIEATDRNTANNVNRGEFLHKTNRALIVTVLAAILAAVPYSIRERTSIASDWTGEQMKQTAPVPGAPPVVPPKPAPPSNFDVRTGVKPPAVR